MKQAIAKRARDTDAKAARRDTILRAAERLFADSRDALPTVADVAEAASLAKGTVYLYFDSQSDIFLTLLLQGWTEVLSRVSDAAVRTRAASPEAIAASLVDALHGRSELLRLDSYGPGLLETQAAPETLVGFKTALADRIVATADAVENALGLQPGEGERLLVNSYSFVRGLWQTSGKGEVCQSSVDENVRRVLHPDFQAELGRALLAYWQGEMSGR